jgi:hypothetical protein
MNLVSKMLKSILKRSGKDDVHYCVSRERDENFERMEERHYNNGVLTGRFRAAQLMDYCKREQCKRGSLGEVAMNFQDHVQLFCAMPEAERVEKMDQQLRLHEKYAKYNLGCDEDDLVEYIAKKKAAYELMIRMNSVPPPDVWEPRETKVRFDGWVPVFMFTPYFDGYCMECLSGDEAIENGKRKRDDDGGHPEKKVRLWFSDAYGH